MRWNPKTQKAVTAIVVACVVCKLAIALPGLVVIFLGVSGVLFTWEKLTQVG